jgi:hypothetical protein
MEGNGWPRASCAAAAWPHELNRLDGSVLGPGLLTLVANDRIVDRCWSLSTARHRFELVH